MRRNLIATLAWLSLSSVAGLHAQSTGCGPDPVYPLLQYCAGTAKESARNGTIRSAPEVQNGAPRDPSGPTSAQLLEDNFLAELTDRPKDGLIDQITRKNRPLGSALKGADTVATAAGVGDEPATALKVVKQPRWFSSGIGFIEASWPDEISPRQGNQPTPERQSQADRDRLAFVMSRCVPQSWPVGTPTTQPLPSVPPPGCTSHDEVEAFDRGVSSDLDREALGVRSEWMEFREHLQMLDEALAAGNPLVSDPGLDPALRDLLRKELYDLKMERNRLNSRGIQIPPGTANGSSNRTPEKGVTPRPPASACTGCASR